MADLVDAPAEWPGFITSRLEETHVAWRPTIYFRTEGRRMPEVVSLTFTIPPILEHRPRSRPP